MVVKNRSNKKVKQNVYNLNVLAPNLLRGHGTKGGASGRQMSSESKAYTFRKT